MDIKETLITRLKNLVAFLNEHEIGYALAGGLAFSALVEPRATMDIHILLTVNEKDMPRFLELLQQAFESIVPHQEPMHFRTIKVWRAVSLADEREIIFDFLLGEPRFLENVVERAMEINFFGADLRIITLEDLILLKNCAKRSQDIADLEKIYTAFRNEIDKSYLEFWSDKLNIELYNPSV